MQDCLLSEEERGRMRRKVAEEAWAAAIVDRLREANDRDTDAPATPYETQHLYSAATTAARQARDIALVHVATGETTHLGKLVELFRTEFRLDAMETPLDSAPPANIDPVNAASAKNWQMAQWSYGLMRSGFFYAYDLLRGHTVWSAGGLDERIETRFAEVLSAQKSCLADVRGWANTNTWYAATCAVLGAMLDDEEAVELAIDGPLGFKAILGLLIDGQIWPEPISYGNHYVGCVLTVIAEVARHTGREDLYAWQTGTGLSLKSLYDGLLGLLFAHGRIAGHGDGGGTSEYANVRAVEAYTAWNHPTDRLWNHRHTRSGNKLEIAYRAYRDPRYAWVLSQDPGRDTWDAEFFGYAALTHGLPLGQAEPPEATSRLWRHFGAALLRGDESAGYWNGTAPAVYVRDGQPQGHGHNDPANILLNAHDRNLYPDLQYKWNYQARVDPATGQSLNPTPYSKMRFSHCTVSVDFAESPGHHRHLAAIRRTGPMQVTVAYDTSVHLRRTIGVTPEYVFDWCCVGQVVGAHAKPEHTIDYHLHSLGLPELAGVSDLAAYTTLGEEYGLGVIDTRSDAPGNQWIRPGVAGRTDGAWQAVMREERPLDPVQPRGVRLHVLGEPGTQVITGDVPDYVSMEGWDATQPEEGTPARFGLLVVRRRAAVTEFVVIHQPFCGEAPAPLEVSRRAETITVVGPGFADRIDLPRVRCRREQG